MVESVKNVYSLYCLHLGVTCTMCMKKRAQITMSVTQGSTIIRHGSIIFKFQSNNTNTSHKTFPIDTYVVMFLQLNE